MAIPKFVSIFSYKFITSTAWKVSKYGVTSGPNTGKYGPEKTIGLVGIISFQK